MTPPTTHLCDTNVWLALATSVHAHHHAATSWLASIDAPRSLAFVRPVQQALLRLLTTHAFLASYGLQALADRAAWDIYDAFASDGRVTLRVDEPPGIERQWREYTARGSASPKLWMDAWLAAFAVTAGYRLVTTDRAFGQFDSLDLLVLDEPGPTPRPPGSRGSPRGA